MKLISATTQKTLLEMIQDVDRYMTVPGFTSTGKIIEKGKYDDAIKSFTDAYSETDLSERLYEVAPYVYRDWNNLYIQGSYVGLNEVNADTVKRLFTDEGIPADLVKVEETDNFTVVEVNQNKVEERITQMPELTDEQRKEYHEKQNELRDQYNQNIQAEFEAMFDSPKELEDVVTRIGNTTPNFSLANRLALAHQGIYDSLMTREGWKKLGFSPKGESVVTNVSVISGDFIGNDNQKHANYKQKAVYGTTSFPKPTIASMAFDAHRKAYGLTGYGSQVRSAAYKTTIHSMKKDHPEIEQRAAEFQVASYLVRKDNKLLPHNAQFKLDEKTDLNVKTDEEKRAFINNVSNLYRDIDNKAKQVAFAKSQELAKERANSTEVQEQKALLEQQDGGLTLN